MRRGFGQTAWTATTDAPRVVCSNVVETEPCRLDPAERVPVSQRSRHRIHLSSSMPDMRSLRVVLLLITALLVGQVQACCQIWLMPDGSECPTCPYSQCKGAFFGEFDSRGGHQSIADSGCSTCCAPDGCEVSVQDTKLQPLPFAQLDLAIVQEEPVVRTLALDEPNTPHRLVQTSFSNAPPRASSPRAPPTPLS